MFNNAAAAIQAIQAATISLRIVHAPKGWTAQVYIV